jgi:hypothetical protein
VSRSRRRRRAATLLRLAGGAVGLAPHPLARGASSLLDAVAGAVAAGAGARELESVIRRLAADRSARAPDLESLFGDGS